MGTRQSLRGATSSWHRFRLIADNSSDVVYQTSTDGIIEWVSPTIETLLGHRPDAVRGTSARDYVHPDDLGLVNQLRQTVYGGAELDEIPCRFLTADGSYRSCSVRARPIHDATGDVVGAVMALRDAHEKTAALRALATLSRANAVLVRERDEQGLIDATCRSVIESGSYRLAWYGRKRHDEVRSVEIVAVAGPSAEAVLTSSTSWREEYRDVGLTGPALLTGTTTVLNFLDDDPRTMPWQGVISRFGLRSGIALPVVADGEVDGVLVVYSDEVGSFDDVAQQAFDDLAADLGYGLERLRERVLLDAAHAREGEHRNRLVGILDAQLDPLVLLEAVRDAVGHIVDLRYVEANAAALSYNGTTSEVLIGRLFSDIHPSLMTNGVTQRYMSTIETGEPVVLDDYSYANPNIGEDQRRYDIRAVKSGDAVALTWRDVTERYAEVKRVFESESRYRAVAANISDVVWETDPDGSMTWVSESITRVLGWRPAEVLGRLTDELFHADDRGRAEHSRGLAQVGLTVHDEYRVRQSDGDYRWMALTAHRYQRAGETIQIAALRDVHTEVEGRRLLEHAVRHDQLTGLVTRSVMHSRVQRALDERVGITAVLKVGVDGLSRINESLDHAAGDAVLAAVAGRIVDVMVDQDLVARGTGDEIIVLLAHLGAGTDAGETADQVRAAVSRRVEVEGQVVHPTVTIGIATSDLSTSQDAEHLMRAAGLAMRDAKKLGPDRTAYVDPRLTTAAGVRMALEAELREAIPAGELRPWFQPVVRLADGSVIAYEALVRWVRPDGTVRMPDEFLPVAEHGALITEIDRSVLTQCVRKLRTLPRHQGLAVNVSSASLIRPDYADLVEGLVAETGIDPTRLVLEITETALLAGVEAVKASMTRLALLGIHWYVDDFGTGYSSIAHLRDLPISGLKLDRSFTVGIGEGDPTCIRLAQALAGLAHGLGLDTVAEGVETDEQAAYLAAQGWVHAQGWLYGKASPIAGAL